MVQLVGWSIACSILILFFGDQVTLMGHNFYMSRVVECGISSP